MTTDRSLGAVEATAAVAAMLAELTKRGAAAVVAVADRHGELLALHRMDGSPLPSILVATNKAYTAARERKTTRELGQAARDAKTGFFPSYWGDPRFVGWGGGVAVNVNGQCLGSVAVSGLSEAEDEEIALIGIKAMAL